MCRDSSSHQRPQQTTVAPALDPRRWRLSRRWAVSALAVAVGGLATGPSWERAVGPHMARAGVAPFCSSSAASFELDPIAGVSFPCAGDFLIPDSANSAWSDDGQRNVEGVVYHRLVGFLDATSAYLRSSEGGQRGLFDIGVDNQTGEIRLWNDPFGRAHPGVSNNRAPWANGPIEDPSPNALAFIDVNDTDAVNRDLVSIAIAGLEDDPISDAGLEAVAQLSAYFAASLVSARNLQWDSYPSIPDRNYRFVHLHNDFASTRTCPGPVVLDAVSEIEARTADILARDADIGY